jgi:hypothetical protein
MVDWKSTQNLPWHQAYIEHASQGGLSLIGDVRELEQGLLDNDCDQYCRPAAGERKIDAREQALLRDLFVTGTYTNHFQSAAWHDLNRMAGVTQGSNANQLRAALAKRDVPSEQTGASRYAGTLSFPSVDDLVRSLTRPNEVTPPFVHLQRELDERRQEIRMAGGPAARGELVWHIFSDYARIFDRPQFRFDDAADMHRRALLQVFLSHPDGRWFGAADADGDRLSNAYERLYGLNPNRAEGGWKYGATEWAPSMSLSGTFDNAAKKIDQWLRGNGRSDGAYRWERTSATAFLEGKSNGNYKVSSTLSEASAMTSTDVDYGLHLLRSSGMDREITATIDGEPNVRVRLVRVDRPIGNTPEEVALRPQEAIAWRIEASGPGAAKFQGTEAMRVFATPLAGVDYLDALEQFVTFSRGGDRIVAHRVDQNGKLIDRNERLTPSAQIAIDAQGKATWTLAFATEAGASVDPKTVGLFIESGGRIKGDAIVKGSKSASWWGMCLELKDFRLAARRLDMPQPTKNVTLTAANGERIEFTASEISEMWARRVLEMTNGSAGYTRVGNRYNSREATVYLKDGRTIRNVELATDLTDRFATATRVHGQVQIPGSELRGFYTWKDKDTVHYLDARLVEKIDAANVITHWDETFTSKRTTTAPETPVLSGLVVIDSKGNRQSIDPAQIDTLVTTTKYDVDLMQMLRYIDHHGGVFGGDGSIGTSISNGAHTATDVARYDSSSADLPDWAKKVLDREKLIGLRGEVSAEDKANILFMAIKDGSSDRYTGWVLLDEHGVPVNGDVISGRFDFMEMNGIHFNWNAPKVYNPNVPDDLPLRLYVRSLEDPSKASRFLPPGWERYLAD